MAYTGFSFPQLPEIRTHQVSHSPCLRSPLVPLLYEEELVTYGSQSEEFCFSRGSGSCEFNTTVRAAVEVADVSLIMREYAVF